MYRRNNMGSMWNDSDFTSAENASRCPNVSCNSTFEDGDTDIFSRLNNSSVRNSGIMFATGFFGNVLALYVLTTSPSEQRRTIFYRLVAGLACTDLIGTTMLSPVVIAVYINRGWIGGKYMCNYFGFAMIFAGYATMTIVCTMSVERVICIKHPYVYYTRLTKKHATIFLVLCWMFAVFIATLPFMGFGEIVKKYPYTWCFIHYYSKNPIHIAYNYLYGILALCIVSATVVCNCTVIMTLIRSRRQQSLLRSRNGSTRKYNGHSKRFAECQMLILLIGITVVFSICYVPMMVRIIMNQSGLVDKNVRLDLQLVYLASFNQILDPWVYILLRRELLWKCISAVKFILRIKPKDSDVCVPKQYGIDAEDENCCAFCLHCLCDPPVNRNRRDSKCSRDSIFTDRRSTVICNSPRTLQKSISTSESKVLMSYGSSKEIHKLLKSISSQKHPAIQNDVDSL